MSGTPQSRSRAALTAARAPEQGILNPMPARQSSAMAPVASAWSAVRGYPLAILLASLAGWTLSNLDQSLFSYAIPGIRSEFHSDLSTIGWILSASFMTTAVITVGIGSLADHYGRKALFVLTLGVSAILVGVQGLAPTLITLGILRTLAFGASNGLAPIVFAYTVEAAPARYRGLFCGALSCGYPLGWFVASLIAAPLVAEHGWRSMFFPALAVVPLAVLLGRSLPESLRFERSRKEITSHSPASDSFAERFKALWAPDLRRRTVLFWLASFLNGGAYAGTAFYFPTFYHEFRHYTESDATYIVGLAYGIGVIGYLSAAVVGEFVLSRRNTIVIWLWTGAAALLGVIWLARDFLQDVLWYAAMACFLYGSQAVMGTFNTEIFPTRVRATALGFSSSFATYAGFAVFPLIVPWVIERIGWQWAFTICSVPLFVLAGVAILGIQNFQSGIDIDAIGQ